ncbi:hypothetical protein Lepto782_02660 [Leptospira interrogans serovar Canicola]|uniref:Uncharacterized protein n=2 Tax=Leptospira interrogans TaxID=173 RepID=A0AAP9WC42_LEPIR|nr:hypothetical protein C4X99_07590 [Leptospira interrogans serovar Geyaweera]QOI41299.1 hypothetical protein Lepto782_02660 [Leptospira interrogans serovar Canicola]QOI49519.1 hypothetical protein Lepto1489_02890 [Leptospira interrogans serovar Bataviae]
MFKILEKNENLEENMKKRFSEDQIHKILKESESGVSTPEICRTMESAVTLFTVGILNTATSN